MTEINVSAETLPVRAFGRQMARELSTEEFATVTELALPTANTEIWTMTLTSSDWIP